MSARKTVVTEVSRRSPRTAWTSKRSVADALAILEANMFVSSPAPVGVILVRVCGTFVLRVTVVDRRATLELAQRGPDGTPLKWRRWQEQIGSEPWRVAREALEFLAVADVDTPVRWG